MKRTTFGVGIASTICAARMRTDKVLAAESYPSRPITIIVPWGVGGGVDLLARSVSKMLQASLNGTTAPVINAPGADGNDGMLKLISDDPDGYTLAILVADTFVDNMLSKTTPPWQMKDITPIAVMNQQPFGYFVAKDSPYQSWADLEKAAKTAPIKVAVTGFGGSEDIATKFLSTNGAKFVSVPYPKPTERYAALLGHQVELMCDPEGNVRHYVEGGQFRPALVLSAKRLPWFPNTPTAKELGHDIVLTEWRAFVAKAGTDPRKIAFLEDALTRLYKTPEFQQFLKDTWSLPDSFVPSSGIKDYFGATERQVKTMIASLSQ